MRFFRKPLGGIDLGLQDTILVVRSKIMIITVCTQPLYRERSSWTFYILLATGRSTCSYYRIPLVVVVCLQAFESFELLLCKLARSFDYAGRDTLRAAIWKYHQSNGQPQVGTDLTCLHSLPLNLRQDYKDTKLRTVMISNAFQQSAGVGSAAHVAVDQQNGG